MDSIIVIIFKVALAVIPILIKDKSKKEEWIKKIKEATEKYNKGVSDSAKMKEGDEELKKKVDAEWNTKWGGK